MFIVRIYATLNEKEMAFSWLERGLATGSIGPFYKDEPCGTCSAATLASPTCCGG